MHIFNLSFRWITTILLPFICLVTPSYPVAAERAELGLLIPDVGILASLWCLPGTMHGIHPLKGLSHEIDFKTFEKKLQNLAPN
jgi:hypothetical protein